MLIIDTRRKFVSSRIMITTIFKTSVYDDGKIRAFDSLKNGRRNCFIPRGEGAENTALGKSAGILRQIYIMLQHLNEAVNTEIMNI